MLLGRTPCPLHQQVKGPNETHFQLINQSLMKPRLSIHYVLGTVPGPWGFHRLSRELDRGTTNPIHHNECQKRHLYQVLWQNRDLRKRGKQEIWLILLAPLTHALYQSGFWQYCYITNNSQVSMAYSNNYLIFFSRAWLQAAGWFQGCTTLLCLLRPAAISTCSSQSNQKESRRPRQTTHAYLKCLFTSFLLTSHWLKQVI